MPLRPKLFVDFHIGRISVRLGIEFKSRMTRRSFRFVQYHVERPRGSRSRACRAIIRSPAFSGGGLLAFVAFADFRRFLQGLKIRVALSPS
jgi:hypothetical protein